MCTRVCATRAEQSGRPPMTRAPIFSAWPASSPCRICSATRRARILCRRAPASAVPRATVWPCLSLLAIYRRKRKRDCAPTLLWGGSYDDKIANLSKLAKSRVEFHIIFLDIILPLSNSLWNNHKIVGDCNKTIHILTIDRCRSEHDSSLFVF